MNELLELLLRASVWLAITVSLLVMLRPLLLRLGGVSLAYAGWWLLPLVLLAIVLPAPVVPDGVAGVLPMTTVLPVKAAVLAEAVPGVPLAGLLLQAWALGALWLLLRNLRAQRRFERALGTLQLRADGAWQAAADPGLPALVGLLRPRIVVGPAFDQQFTAQERGLVLAHEHSHRRHGDHWVNAAMLLLRCAFWFHPLLPWAARRLVRDQELACDARTIGPQPALRRTYASALLKAQLVHPVAPMACYWRSQTLLKERITMLKDAKRGVLLRTCGGMVVAGLCMGVATLAWASQGPQVGGHGGGTGGNAGTMISAEATPVPGQGAAAAGDQDAVAILMSPPRYPKGAFDAGQAGKVVLHVEVLTDGRAGTITVQSSTNPIFDEASVEAARQWTFRPAVRNGKAVVSKLRIPIDFALDKDKDA